jgi:hypothetical protein
MVVSNPFRRERVAWSALLALGLALCVLLVGAADASPPRPVTLSNRSLDAHRDRLVVGPQGHAVVVWNQGGDTCRVRARFRRAGRWGPIVPVSGERRGCFDDHDDPSVAVARDGRVTVVWADLPGGGSVKMRSAAPNGRFGPIRTIARVGPYDPQVIAGPRGKLVVLWREFSAYVGVLKARTVYRGGRLGPIVQLSSRQGRLPSAHDAVGAIDSHGRLTVAWTLTRTLEITERSEVEDFVIQARSGRLGGRLGPIQTLSQPRVTDLPSSPHLTVDRRGRATVAWSEPVAPGEFSGFLASARPGRRFGPAESLGPHGGYVLTGARDRLIVVGGTRTHVQIRSRLPGRRFGPIVSFPGRLWSPKLDSCGRLLATYTTTNEAGEEALSGRWGRPSGHFGKAFRLFGYGPTPYGGLPHLYSVAAGGKGTAVATRLRSVASGRSVLEALSVPQPQRRCPRS